MFYLPDASIDTVVPGSVVVPSAEYSKQFFLSCKILNQVYKSGANILKYCSNLKIAMVI